MELVEKTNLVQRFSVSSKIEKIRSSYWVSTLAPPVLALIGIILQLSFQDWTGSRHFLFLYPALFLGCFIGSGRSVFGAALLATTGAWYFLLPVPFSFELVEPMDLFSLLTFFVTGGILSLICNRILTAHQAVKKLEIKKRESQIAEAQQTQQRLQEIIETIPQGIWRTNLDGSADYFSQQFGEIVGYDAKDMLGWGWYNVIHPDDQPRVQKEWQRTRDLGIPVAAEFRIKGRDGQYRWYLSEGNPYRDGTGRILKYYGTWTNIHEKKLADEKMRASEERYRLLTEVSPQIIWTSDRNGKITFANHRWFDYTGLTLEETLDEGWLRVIHPTEQAKAENEWSDAVTRKTPSILELRLKRKESSEYRWHKVMAKPIFDQNHEVSQWVGVAVDQHDERLARLEAELKSDALENSLNGFDIVSSEGKFLYANQAYLKMWGYDSLDEILGTSPADHCADPDVPLKIITTLKEKGECAIEFLAKRKNGSTFEVMMWARLAHDAEGNEIYPTTSIDITERKFAEEKLKDQSDLFRTITNNAASCLFMMDQNGHPTFMNPAAEALTGYTLDEIRNRPLHYAVHYKKPDGSHYPMEECPIDNAQAELKPLQNQEEIFTDKYGRLFPVSYSVAPLEKEGQVIGSVLEFRDITEQKNAVSDLRLAKEEAERASELKSAFLANMSHEIRTPLGAMIGFADLLREPDLSPEDRASYIEVLTRNGEQLGHIINDILDLSKVEAGHLILEYAPTSVREIASEVVSLLSVKAGEKNVSMDLWIDPGAPKKIVTDPFRVKQILANVVGNAVKFTESGHIRVKAGTILKGNSELVAFEVEDTGLGISEEQASRVFEMFVQADGSMTRRFGGTGLGLSLSRKLARQLGGDVELTKTQVGQGSTFLVTIENHVNP